jgi:anti-sigma B factor antagonist
MKFSINTKEEKGMWIVTLSGEVDLHTGNDFKKAILEGIDSGHKQVVVDFSRATFIDSTALGILVGAVKRLNPHGGKLHVIVNTPNIRKIFEITALDRVLDLHENMESIVS